MELTSQQQHDVCLILSTGCDRLAAAKYVGCSLADLRRAMRNVPQFAADVRRSEAVVEMTHMGNVRNAARDDKHWRASVWWLERRAPERYGRRDAGVVTTQQIESFVDQLVAAVAEEIHDEGDRERLLGRLNRVAESLDQRPADVEPQPGWLGSSPTTAPPRCPRAPGASSWGLRAPDRTSGRVDPSHPVGGEDTEWDETELDREP